MGCTEKNLIELIKGEDKEFVVRIVRSDTEEPFDLTGVAEIKARFKKADGTALEKLYTATEVVIVSALGGKIKVILSDADTVLLEEREQQDVEIEIFRAGITTIVQLLKVLSVRSRIV